MSVLLDARPAGVDAYFRPGDPFPVTANFPAGALTGRTFAATLDAADLSVIVAGDSLTITATAAQTAAVTGTATFTLTDTTETPRVVFVGRWAPSIGANAVSSLTFDVTDQATTVEVTVVGDNAEQARLEAYGAGVGQTMTTDYRTLFVDYIRNAGSSSPTAGRNFLGGDVVDAVQVTSTTWWWLCLDLWDGGTNIVDTDDTFKNVTLLPQRNGQIEETPKGTLTTQGYATAPGVLSGPFLNAVTQGGHPAGYFWWTVGGVRPTIGSGNIYIVCYLIDEDDPTSPTHGVLGTELIAINAFGLYDHKVSFITPGWQDENFYLSAMRNDATDGFIYCQGTVINLGLESPAITDLDGYRAHRGQARKVARVAPASIENPAAYEFWTGAGWSSDVADAAPQVDNRGSVIYGLTGNPVRVSPGRWITVGRQNVLDPFLDVYAAAVVQGPWTKIARVPAKGVGGGLGESGLTLASHHATVIPHITAPADHSVAVMTCLGIGSETLSWDQISIRRWAPLFVVVPHF